MNVKELSRKQIEELKDGYYRGHTNHDAAEVFKSPMEVPDEVIFNCYDGYDFVDDDFTCSADGRGELDSLLNPHFTEDEIEKLIEWAREGYEDASGEPAENHMDMIHEFIPTYMMDMTDTMDDFNAAFEEVIGRKLTEEEWNRLCNDMDERWLES